MASLKSIEVITDIHFILMPRSQGTVVDRGGEGEGEVSGFLRGWSTWGDVIRGGGTSFVPSIQIFHILVKQGSRKSSHYS